MLPFWQPFSLLAQGCSGGANEREPAGLFETAQDKFISAQPRVPDKLPPPGRYAGQEEA